MPADTLKRGHQTLPSRCSALRRTFAAALLLALGVGAAPAATLTVTNTLDSGAGSLRQSIANAIAGDAINFDPALSGATILLTNGQITLDKNLTIDASALPGGIALNGINSSRIFSLPSGVTNVLTALTITNGNSLSDGGAIHNVGKLTLNQCTFAGNRAATYGGAIFNSGPLVLNECTLALNLSSFSGGAIYNNSTSMTVNQSTICSNTASDGAGIRNANTLTMTNSIVAGNSGDINVRGPFTGTSNLTNGIPILAPLGNYGGPTQTMPPLAGSPALNATSSGLPTDQRGVPRPQGANFDLGAAEGFFLSLSQSGGNVTLSWPTVPFAQNLKSASTVTGPWTNATSQANPQTNPAASDGPQLFFLLGK